MSLRQTIGTDTLVFVFLMSLLLSFFCGHGCRPILPPVRAFVLMFFTRRGFSIPKASRFPSNIADSRSRAFRESISSQENYPMIRAINSCTRGGFRTIGIGLTSK